MAWRGAGAMAGWPKPEVVLRPFFHALAAALFFAAPLWSSPARSECRGSDLFAALSPAEQAALSAQAAAAPHGEGLVFRATRGVQEIVLAGTMHLPDARHDALLAELAPHLARAGTLLVEATPGDEAKLKAAAGKDPSLLFITEGPTIPELLPEADWQALRQVLVARGMAPFIAAKMQPAFLAITLSVPPCALEALGRGEGGLDKRLMAAATARGLPIEGLEPWDTAFALFRGLSAQQNADILRQLTREALEAEDQSVTMANRYFARTPRLIWEFALHHARAQGMAEDELARQAAVTEQALMTGRNRLWVPVLEAAAEKGPVLAAFGALHLSGREGVLALLEQDGWRIERLD